MKLGMDKDPTMPHNMCEITACMEKEPTDAIPAWLNMVRRVFGGYLRFTVSVALVLLIFDSRLRGEYKAVTLLW